MRVAVAPGLLLLLASCPQLAASQPRGLRFAVGDRVECNVGDRWEPGRVVRLYYRSGADEGAQVAPYQAELDSGAVVYAPHDDDAVIRSRERPVKDPQLRFAVGDRVEANMGDRWALGTVIALKYFSEGGHISPYHVRLDGRDEVFAPRDDDGVIRRADRPTTDAALRFAVGERVEANLGDHWALGTVVALNYYRQDGATAPYQVQLDSGTDVFAPRDDDSVIRLVRAAGLAAGGGEAGGGSKFAQRRVGPRASMIGTKFSGSKLSGSKRGKPQQARAHKSALPESREDALARWRAISEGPGGG